MRVIGVNMDRVMRNDINYNFGLSSAGLDDVKDRIDNIIQNNPQPSEVVDARGSFPVLRDRLDNVDTEFTQKVPLSEQIKGNSNTKYKIIAGAIRNDGTGWKLIDDPTHKNINLLDVYIDPTDNMRLRLDHSFTATTIGTLNITTDETFAKIGLVCGNSGGKGYNLLELAAPLHVQTAGSTTIVNASKYHAGSTSLAQLADGTGFTLTHNSPSTTQPPIAVIADGGSNSGVGGEIQTDFTLSTTTVRYYQYLHGYVRWNTTTSVFDMSTDNVDKATVAWDATNSALQISHPTINEEYIISVTATSSYKPEIYTQTTGQMLVRFTNSSGTLVTTPDANMKCNFIRFSKVRSSFPSGLRCNIFRGLAKVTPANISEEFGNFWIIGINESD